MSLMSKIKHCEVTSHLPNWDSENGCMEPCFTVAKKKAKAKYTAAMEIWKVWEMDRKGQNAVLKSGWDENMKIWTVE